MFDGKIEFNDFEKIKINTGGKLTCKKVFKKRFLIALVLFIIVIVLLGVFHNIKSNEVLKTITNVKEIKNTKETQEGKLKEENNDIKKFNTALSQIINLISNLEYGLSEKREERMDIEKINTKLNNELDSYEKESYNLTQKIKNDYPEGLKDKEEINILKSLLETYKKEYENLKKEKEIEKNPILESKIITPEQAKIFEQNTNTKIESLCYDGLKSKYEANIFHDNCDNSSLLILIKTNEKENIGAYTSIKFSGFNIFKDDKSLLINFDTNKYYKLNNDNLPTVVCDPNELPQFGIDLKIDKNKGINGFPFNYGDQDNDKSTDLTKFKKFVINNLEIYKLKD